MVQESKPSRWPIVVAAIALTYLVCAVFFPILGFEFIELDVPGQVINNPHIRGLTAENLKHILTSRCVTSYYPVRTLTYAVDYQLWGLNPTGFKLTNGLVHLANVLLVFWLALRLFSRAPVSPTSETITWRDVAMATFAAGIFAVHPVIVEPVVWVSGREELLMTLGALGCIHFHLTARRLQQQGACAAKVVACYLGTAFCCAVACFSNAVGAVIPFLIVAWDLLSVPPPRFSRVLCETSALWLVSVATLVVKRVGYTGHAALQEAGEVSSLVRDLGYGTDHFVGEVSMFSVERLMLVMEMYWSNLRSLFWPNDLAISYDSLMPRSFGETGVILGGVAVVATCLVLWFARKRRTLLFGLVWFVLALGPVAQIIPHHIHRADRFLYLPLIGLTMAIAIGLRPLVRVAQRRSTAVGVGVAGVLGLLLLDVLSASQVRKWHSNLTVWENCVGVAPNNFVAHRILADHLAKAGDHEAAQHHYRIALAMNVQNARALDSFAIFLATAEDHAQRDYELAIRLATRACELSDWQDPNTIRTLAIAHNNLADDLRGRGEVVQAIEHYRQAIERDPDYASPVFNLALLLATCSDPKLQDTDEAVRLAERASKMVDPVDANQLMILAIAYAAAGQSDRAARTTEQAIQAADAEGDVERASVLRERLEIYRSQVPESSEDD